MKNKFKLFAAILSTLLIMNFLFGLSINASSNVSNYTIGISNNQIYYIMNVATGRLLYSDTQSTGDYASVITRNPAITSAYWSTYATKWQLHRLSDGSFEIYGGEGNGAILKSFGNTIETECNDNNNQSKFILTRSDSNHQGTYTIKNLDNGDYLTEITDKGKLTFSDSPVAASYWSLMAVEKRTVDFYTFNYTHSGGIYNTTSNGDLFISSMETMGYNDAYHATNFRYIDNITTFLQEDDIFIFFGHGAPSELRFYGEGNSLNGQLMANSAMAGANDYNQYFIDSIPDNGLCKSRCVILLADNVGNSSNSNNGSYNMVEAIYEKGAHFVLGITESDMNEEQVDIWLAEFLESISAGNRIFDAIRDADGVASVETTYCGDTAQYLKMGA